MPAGVLFIHNNFPAQFRPVIEGLIARGVPCWGIGAAIAPGMPGVKMARYGLARGTGADVFELAVRAEADLLRAEGAYRAAKALKDKGIEPAVIVGHPGWGETALMKALFPDTPQILFAEYYYHGRDSDLDFDNEFHTVNDSTLIRVRAKNAVLAMALTEAEVIVTPTRFQAGRLPPVFQPRVRIIHEGVDLDAVPTGPVEPFVLDDGRIIAPGTPVITHVNNQLEPLRGLHIFARALPRLLAEVPDAQVLIFGREKRQAYGGDAPDGMTWKQAALRGLEGKLDPARVHFLGKVDHARMLTALRLSTAHIYYTYPFVLSWSLAEAMACGCYVIASDTAPVHDALEDGVSGKLLPFFDVEALSAAMIEACRHPHAADSLRAAAKTAAYAKFSRTEGRAAWLALLNEVAGI